MAVTAAAPAQAASSHTVKVKMSDSSITFSGGGSSTANGVTSIHSGRYHFHVVTSAGNHALQLLRFKNGYTAQQAGADLPKAFQGNVAAVQRIDNGVTFRGGADARPGNPGDMVVILKPGKFFAIDQNGNAVAQLSVVGHPVNPGLGEHSGTYTAFSYGWSVSKHLPAAGTVKVTNQADQPHFLVIQRVKDSTTNATVRKALSQGGERQPAMAAQGHRRIGRHLARDQPAGELRPPGRQVLHRLLLARLLHWHAALPDGHVEARHHRVVAQHTRHDARRAGHREVAGPSCLARVADRCRAPVLD